MTRWTGDSGEITDIDPKQIEQMRSILDQVGARLSDVFGADKILWVEGPTEERCIPMILKHFGGSMPVGIVVLGLVNTGDVFGKQKILVQRIYKKLSSSSTLIPPAISIILDREGLSEQEIADYRRESGGLVSFLPKRCFENYLLHPGAIEIVLNAQDSLKEKITQSGITTLITATGDDAEYFKPLSKAAFGTLDWDQRINGAKVLKKVFALRDIEYDKAIHGVALTEAVLSIIPANFQDWAELLKPAYSSQ
ncbi:MAG: hypothetical protein HOP13_04115 [Alphaproteobacteria bacterium]|nr:hypothetical protein [Alphaproteobacteria bacterium]